MNEVIEIRDDFDLEKIRLSGQAFRILRTGGNSEAPAYSFFYRGNRLDIQQVEPVRYKISSSRETFDKVWRPYFDLDRNYSEIRSCARGKNEFLDVALDFGRGLRILRQDPWEMVVTFIVSQRRSMPAIATAVDKIARNFGNYNKGLDYFEFPTPERICEVSQDEIRDCGVGYRAPYIQDAAQKVASGEVDLQKCETLGDEALFETLTSVSGVGPKVANCIMLFGYARLSRAPVDVWIERVINEQFAGKDPFPDFGDVAGIIQQYMFFWRTQNK